MTFALDKMQIDDALGVNTYQMPAGAPNPGAPFGAPPLGAPQQPQPMATRFGGLSANMGAQAGPGHLQAGANFAPNLGFRGAHANYAMPAAGGQLNINADVNPLFQLAQLGAQYNKGNVNANVAYAPGQGVSGGMRYQAGPASANVAYAPGQGVSGGMQYQAGPVSANVNYQPGAGVGGGVQYQNGPLAVGGGYDPRRGAYGNLAVRQRFQEGGLATPQTNEDFVHNRDQQMHELVGKVLYDHGGFAAK